MTVDPTRPMRIAVFGGRGVPSTYSGVETICENLFELFAKMGHKVTVYCRPQVMTDKLGTHKGIRLVRTPAPGGKQGETLTHSLFSLRHALSKGDVHEGGRPFDLISIHAIAPNFWNRLASGKVPMISHVHGLDHQREKWKGIGAHLIRHAERSMVRHSSQIVTVNREIVSYYKTKFGVDAALLPNGIHPVNDQFAPDQPTLDKFNLERGKFIVTIGRLVPEKRQHDTIAAFANVKTDMKLVVVGEGPHTPDYVAMLQARAKSDPRVVFTGLQKGDALQTLFRCAKLYVTASELEGLPSSLLECLDRNVCAVVSDIAPHREVMENVSGYHLFFNPGDVDSLSERITRALSDDAMSARLALDARRFVRQRYTWPVLAEETEQLYRHTLCRTTCR